MTAERYRVAIDIGGTFTDIQILNMSTGQIGDFKSPTTPEDPSIGLLNGLRGAGDRYGFELDQIELILHGSTIATNAVLERKLPKGALLTTAGFTDILEIGRHMRRNVYALKAETRSVLIPRHRRFAVTERIRANGDVETPLDQAAVRTLGHRLVEDDVQAVAIMFLHSYRNPRHEQQAAKILGEIPGLSVATSHQSSPEIREFERASTTVLNALLKPVISTYLERLEDQLAQSGLTAKLLLVQSNGGLATPGDAAELPAKLLLSGPAGGAMAMVDLARRHELQNIVGLDMGGTSSDVSVVQDGQVQETQLSEIDGLPVRLPMIDIRTIGAGGGSLAQVQDGALRVGPQSAGAQPGPACYGRGGTKATVTDANLAIGLIDPDGFLGGQMRLDQAAAETAVDHVAQALDLSPQATAAGIVQVANAAMSGAVRLSLFEKGADPADFTLASFGGAGALHACAIAEELEIRQILFPATASTLSARGILTSDLRHDLMVSELIPQERAPDALPEIVANLRAQATELLSADDVSPDDREIQISADMRYRGQAYEITTDWALRPDAPVNGETVADLVAAFHRLHQSRYAHSAPGDPVEIVTVRAKAIGHLSGIATRDAATSSQAAQPDREVFHRGATLTVPVLQRNVISEPVSGPLIVQEDYAVLWIQPGWTLTPLPGGDLMASKDTAA